MTAPPATDGDAAPRTAPVVPLRPMSAADVLDGGFRLLRAAPAAVLVPAVVVAVVLTVADTALRLVLDVRASVSFNGDGTARSTVGGAFLAGVLRQLASSVLGTVGVAVVGAFVAGVLVCTLSGRRPTLAVVWRVVRGRLAVAVVVGLLVGIVQTVGLVLLVAPGVWLWTLFALAAPVTVVERAGVTRALGRSAQVVSGGFWRVLGLRTLTAVTALAFGYLFQVPFTVIAQQFTDSSTTQDALTALGTLLTSAVVLPLRAGVDVTLYLDQRIRREAFDVTYALATHPAPRR